MQKRCKGDFDEIVQSLSTDAAKTLVQAFISTLLEPEHVSGAGAENGEEPRPEKRMSGSGAVSGLNQPFTIRSNLTMTDFEPVS